MILRKKFSDVSLFHMYYRVLNMCLHHTWMNVASGFEACVHSYLGIRQLIGGVGFPLRLCRADAGASACDLRRPDIAASRLNAAVTLSRM